MDSQASQPGLRIYRTCGAQIRSRGVNRSFQLPSGRRGCERFVRALCKLSLSSCDWIRRRENCIITGPAGAGKSYLGCALANKACREGFDALYFRVPRLFDELSQTKADGSYTRRLNAIARCELLMLDDWGIAPFKDEQRRDMLEILDDRYGRRSTLVAAQVPMDKWHEVIADPTLADAILDRLVHNAYRIQMKGESMSKIRGGLTFQQPTQA